MTALGKVPPAQKPALGGRLLVVVGPTATGKSRLAARLGKALDGEVVSADSVQVYRGFDIGAGKPTPEELSLCPHHLIDVVAPDEPLEARVFAQLAEERIEEIRLRGKVPIVCGGTFLWVRSLLFGLVDAPEGDENLRARHKKVAEEEGRSALHARLLEVDPEAAARLHPQDFVRVSRALEVFELTGTPLSALQAAHGFRTPRYDALLLGVSWPLDVYEERLRERVRAMMEQGFCQEVRSLVERGYSSARAMGAVGYRQVHEALTAEASGGPTMSEEDLVAAVVRVTRVFARRQRTWLRDEPVHWLEGTRLDDEGYFSELCADVNAFLASTP